MSGKVKYIVNNDYPIDDNTKVILDKMSNIDGVEPPVVALPDLHFKYSYHTPTGVVAMTKDKIIPKFVNANCGMSFVKTPFFMDELDDNKLDAIFRHLRDHIAITTRLHPTITNKDLEEIVEKGAEWTFKKYDLNDDDLKNMENDGSIFKKNRHYADKIMSYIPETCRDIGLLSMGVLGYGNHFIEMQVVDEIINPEIAEKFGIKEKQLCFMIHSDSRGFGQSLLDFYSKRAKRMFGLQQIYKKIHYRVLASRALPIFFKRILERTNFYLNRLKSILYWKSDKFIDKTKINFEVIDAFGEEAKGYITSTYAAINFGYANRAYHASTIRDALRKVFNKKDADISILHDGNHDSLQVENIDGTDFFAHRNGASRALPPGYYRGHPIFAETGQPVLLPTSLARPSFLCAATKGCRESFYSTCHGTGRIIDRGEARAKYTRNDLYKETEKARMRIYDYGGGKAQEEVPHAFKDADKVLKAMVENNIAEPVVKLRPLATLKGWK